jgi:hypothetical protein
MTVRQHFDPAQRKPRYSKEEFAQRGDAIYETPVRPQVEEGNHGKIVAISLKPEPLRLQMTFYPQPIAYLSDSPMLNPGSSASDIKPFIASK